MTSRNFQTCRHDPDVLNPRPGLPRAHNLIVDTAQFFTRYHRIKPCLANDAPQPEKKHRQHPTRATGMLKESMIGRAV